MESCREGEGFGVFEERDGVLLLELGEEVLVGEFALFCFDVQGVLLEGFLVGEFGEIGFEGGDEGFGGLADLVELGDQGFAGLEHAGDGSEGGRVWRLLFE